MRIIKITSLQKQFLDLKQPIAAIWGFFDGWHLGHQALLRQLQLVASKKNYQTLVISFDVKPQVFFKKSPNLLLTDPDTKITYLQKNKIDYYCEIQFSEQIAQENEHNFIAFLKSNNVKTIIVNRAIRFGHNGKGNLALLQLAGFEVIICENVTTENGTVISSTYLKALLEAKAIAEVNKYLGVSPFRVVGKVVDGIKEGRKLGFPTANLELLFPYFLPSCGVYITSVKWENNYYPAATVILMRAQQKIVETYLLDFNQDLYGEIITVYFYECIREYSLFTNLAALIAVIKSDIIKVRQYFQHQNSSLIIDL